MKLKVLIVDDDDAITQQLFWTLCDEFEVLTAKDLPSAVRRATVYEPQLSILDLHLPPTLDSPSAGLLVLDYIKGRYPESKVLVVSSDADEETRKACAAKGANCFLEKPFDIETLLAAIHRIAPEAELSAF
ncbi:MAG TPA: response regulator transcription factor [Pyrinomonadaceae bacterium]|nr:response regulator transcription factor [Pyrinomonadaceae bacterium]